MWLVVFGIVYSGYLRMKSLEMQDFIHYQSTNFPYEQLISRISTWLVAGMFIFWIIGEVSERIFIENYFFFLAFFSMTIGRPNSDC
jgi:competence CoiA-like predicted nuclease